MIGEGWHEIMYYNVIGTKQFYSLYFIIYITFVSIIIANVFVGLFLADIDELTQQQSKDEIEHHAINKTKSFEAYAYQKKNKLYYKIDINKHENHLMEQQIHHIDNILYQQHLNSLNRSRSNSFHRT